MRTPQSIRKYDMIADPKERAYQQFVESIIINENEKQKKLKKFTHKVVKLYKGSDITILKQEVKSKLNLFDSEDLKRIKESWRRTEAAELREQFEERLERYKARFRAQMYKESGRLVGFTVSDDYCEYNNKLKQSE